MLLYADSHAQVTFFFSIVLQVRQLQAVTTLLSLGAKFSQKKKNKSRLLISICHDTEMFRVSLLIGGSTDGFAFVVHRLNLFRRSTCVKVNYVLSST